ncbi:hypothetical protein BDV29DRAFT_119523 [Aspergillus leporis]|jgi:hypothetical protein|uniref:Uncharacterized protein n=1 Tax=Aspergillus leporis TaxID=41062 RepID=A0A5N5X1E7_9EURO|nr:hypothetical protein BDV29DRAFT_119523 [Aspergillus leporis]
MYCQVHDTDIERGIVVVKIMSIQSNEGGPENLLAQKKLELSEYAEGAQQSIRAVVKAVRRTLSSLGLTLYNQSNAFAPISKALSMRLAAFLFLMLNSSAVDFPFSYSEP